MGHILPAEPVADWDHYRAGGGGTAFERCQAIGPKLVLSEIRASGLRGRGGAGFPTGIKWEGLAGSGAATRFVICNAAEGEPGTFKDRVILRRNPYQVLEGLAIAAYATGASEVFVGIKAKFATELSRLEVALSEVVGAGFFAETDVTVVPGPDDYLFGEEKGLLEAIEGKEPLPRLYPPYVQGLWETQGGAPQPAVVNNVETIANVTHILERGSAWYRSMGTEQSPGTVVATIGGDTVIDAVAEVEMGTPLRTLIDDVGGGVRTGRAIKMVLNGVSNAPLTGTDVDVPLAFETMREAGSGLGSAGFTVYDDTACVLGVASAASAFLFRGSCGQCPSCKLGTGAIEERFSRIAFGDGELAAVEELAAWTLRVTDANRCGLGAGQQAVARGVMEKYPEELATHASGGTCGSDRTYVVTTISDWDELVGRFAYSLPIRGDSQRD